MLNCWSNECQRRAVVKYSWSHLNPSVPNWTRYHCWLVVKLLCAGRLIVFLQECGGTQLGAVIPLAWCTAQNCCRALHSEFERFLTQWDGARSNTHQQERERLMELNSHYITVPITDHTITPGSRMQWTSASDANFMAETLAAWCSHQPLPVKQV